MDIEVCLQFIKAEILFFFEGVMSKQGTEFEKFSKELYEELLGQHDLKNLKIQHDISLRGTTGQLHQIDVYWEFMLGGITHKVAVECKDYTSAVTIGRIRDFAAALDDIGGIKGIFLTKVGYQSGAKLFAKGKGIALKTVKSDAITIEDFKGSGLVTEVHANFIALMVDNVVPSFEFDVPYIMMQIKEDKFNIAMDCTDDQVLILDKEKQPLFSLYQFTESAPREPTNTQGLVFEKDLSKDLHFLDFPNNPFPLKINSIKITYDTISSSEQHIITAKATAKAIIRDILDDTCEVIGVKRLA